MKLLYCEECSAVFNLHYDVKTCDCGNIGGFYTDRLNAVYWGNAILLGFDNMDFIYQKSMRETGPRFEAFFISSECKTLKKITLEERDKLVLENRFEELKKLLSDLEENFENLIERQILFSNFEEKIKEIVKLARSATFTLFEEGLSYLEDVVHIVKSKDLNIGQVKALKNIIEILTKLNLSKNEIMKIDDILLDADIDTIPPRKRLKK